MSGGRRRVKRKMSLTNRNPHAKSMKLTFSSPRNETGLYRSSPISPEVLGPSPPPLPQCPPSSPPLEISPSLSGYVEKPAEQMLKGADFKIKSVCPALGWQDDWEDGQEDIEMENLTKRNA